MFLLVYPVSKDVGTTGGVCVGRRSSWRERVVCVDDAGPPVEYVMDSSVPNVSEDADICIEFVPSAKVLLAVDLVGVIGTSFVV